MTSPVHDLKRFNLTLFRRVRIKSIVHALLGFTILFAPPASTSRQVFDNPLLTHFFNINTLAVVFLVLGVIIGIGLYAPQHNYKLARYAIAVSAVYSLMWWVAILLGAIASNFQTGMVSVVFWGYWVYNLFIIVSDSAWQQIYVRRQIEGREDGSV